MILFQVIFRKNNIVYRFEHEIAPESELLDIVSKVKTLEGDIEVYKDAEIEIATVQPQTLRPIALYVLAPTLRRLQIQREELLAQGIDIFTLQNVIEYSHEGTMFHIAPPIIELLPEGELGIIDGIHRVYQAMIEGEDINVVMVKNVHPEYPPISLPVEWDVVDVVDAPPGSYLHRRILRPGLENTSEVLRRFYRDYSILGSSGRRPMRYQEG